MTMVKEIKLELRAKLKSYYSDNEINSLSKQLFAHILKYNSTHYVLNDNELVTTEAILAFNQALARLQNYEPIQYITGSCEFYGLDINVSTGVLIPRPETEELIVWIRETVKSPTHLVDICTGSGCIALALKSLYPNATIEGWDISPQALAIALKNSEKLHLPIKFVETDILQYQPNSAKKVDIIVSNPPYVRDSEKLLMTKNVLAFEPHLALFVEDKDPLLFYTKIAKIAKEELSDGGYLFFEINEAFGKETLELLDHEGFSNIRIKKDMSGRDRMVMAQKRG